MSAYRIVIADDHSMFRQGLKKLIQESEQLAVTGEAKDGIELLKILKDISADMIILDISMPKLRGIEATREIKMSYPKVKVLILTMHKKKEYLYHALSAGADGFLLKEDTDKELFSAIKKIREGKFYLSPILSSLFTEDLLEIYRGHKTPPQEPLTNREREVLKLIAEGNSNKEIADLLFISTRTAENHRASIMRKLNTKNTADLVRYAINMGYLSETTP